ncbi:hypothetical protein RJ640_013179 [Escallonia rubra]|uniref:Uncharacterized protein n=1 Tax=Escallonia rubra TaxID=112253 RepID=A0AA88UR20_9ASTE|nr:hypothetical protein RJ640_013179 [Escallonia rubra]
MGLNEPKSGQAPRIENPEALDETTDTEIRAGDQQQVPETPNLKRRTQSLLEDGQLNLEKIEGNKNPADMLTKRLRIPQGMEGGFGSEHFIAQRRLLWLMTKLHFQAVDVPLSSTFSRESAMQELLRCTNYCYGGGRSSFAEALKEVRIE